MGVEDFVSEATRVVEWKMWRSLQLTEARKVKHLSQPHSQSLGGKCTNQLALSQKQPVTYKSGLILLSSKAPTFAISQYMPRSKSGHVRSGRQFTARW